jgi:hypothetical protein
LDVDDVDPVALDPATRIPASLEAIGSEQREEITLQQIVEAFVGVHRVLRANDIVQQQGGRERR